MSFSATGDCQLVSQIYEYKRHRVVCSVKVLPTPVTHFERESRNDYHWMTADRWARIESGLWRLFENLAQWEDAQKLHTELLIDHINVRVQATEKPDPATLTLLAGEHLSPKDLSLDIQLQYITHEDTTIVGVLTTKRKHATEAEANGSSSGRGSSVRAARAGSKIKISAQTKPPLSKHKHIDADEDNEDEEPLVSQVLSKVKRERRSISQGCGIGKSTKNGRIAGQENPKTQTPPQRKSRAISVESKPARRSCRSPTRPSRFKNFILGETLPRKGKPEKKETKAKGSEPAPAKLLKVEQMDGARFDALQRLDSMLDMPKPKEVKILLLENMGEEEVLCTFDRYRSDFDKLFKERQNKLFTNNYKSVDHMQIMDILTKSIHDTMIKKLAEIYSKRSAHTSLLINGLLPLWIIRLFMDTYNMSLTEAVTQIGDQMKYNTYLKALNDEPLSSDLDD
ncbi:hypothetical protein KR009_011556 [Drosophila setifemur]|nr:hypothetical protein KR009_011556 [Drosophila setifemur]